MTKRRTSKPSKAERSAAERRRKLRRNLGLALGGAATVAVILAVALAGGNPTGAGPSAPDEIRIAGAPGVELVEGDEVPAFSLPALDGGRLEWSDYEGHPTVLALWAPWCPHCQKELPVLSDAVAGFPEVRMLSVATAIDQAPHPPIEGYMAEHGLTFPVGLDDANDTIGRGLGVSAFPTVYFVGADGRVMHAAVGEIPPDELHTILVELAG